MLILIYIEPLVNCYSNSRNCQFWSFLVSFDLYQFWLFSRFFLCISDRFTFYVFLIDSVDHSISILSICESKSIGVLSWSHYFQPRYFILVMGQNIFKYEYLTALKVKMPKMLQDHPSILVVTWQAKKAFLYYWVCHFYELSSTATASLSQIIAKMLTKFCCFSRVSRY